MTFGYFSPPYPGETFYSCIARYLVHSGLNTRQFFFFYFKQRPHAINQRLPCSIQQFADKIKDITSITADEIIQNHTLYKFYSTFMNLDKARSLYSYMLGRTGRLDSHVKLNLSGTDFPYCRLCAEEDTARFGESFWHSVHSIPFIQVCPKHHFLLSVWRVPPEKVDPRRYYESRLSNLQTTETKVKPSSLLLKSCKTFEAFLTGSLRPDFDTFIEQAKSKGFFLQKRNAYSLNQSLLAKYIEYLEKGRSNFSPTIINDPTVVNKLFNGRMFPYNPQNFVFLTNFLDSLPKIKAKPDFKQVTCCNKLCSHFKKPIPREHYELLKIEYKKKTGAKVQCPFCGIEFVMTIEPNSKHLIITEYGPLTREVVQAGVKEGKSFRQLELELGISRKRIKSIYISSGHLTENNTDTHSKLIAQRRSLWESELNSKDFVSLAKSKEKFNTVLRWLQKNDPEWTRKINSQFRSYPKGRPIVKLTKKEDIVAFKNKLDKIRADVLRKRIPRRVSLTLFQVSLSKRERTILNSDIMLKSYCQSLTESNFEFKLRRIDYFLAEYPELSFSKTFICAKFKISHSIDGDKKEQLQSRLQNLIL